MQLKMFPFSESSLYILGYCKGGTVYSYRLSESMLQKAGGEKERKKHTMTKHESMSTKLSPAVGVEERELEKGWVLILNRMNTV